MSNLGNCLRRLKLIFQSNDYSKALHFKYIILLLTGSLSVLKNKCTLLTILIPNYLSFAYCTMFFKEAKKLGTYYNNFVLIFLAKENNFQRN